MSDIRSFFPSAAAAPPPQPRGRPPSASTVARDAKGRALPKYKRSRGGGSAADSGGDSETEHADRRAAARRTNWNAPEQQARLQAALNLVRLQGQPVCIHSTRTGQQKTHTSCKWQRHSANRRYPAASLSQTTAPAFARWLRWIWRYPSRKLQICTHASLLLHECLA